MPDQGQSSSSTECPSCPTDGCGNDELDETPDDPEHEYFCHWCGNLFEPGEVEA